jgi:hypothetical protein
MKGGRYGFVDNAGKLILSAEYEQVRPFRKLSITGGRTAVALVKRYGKWGFVDASGKTLIPFKYEDADEFHQIGKDNIARVKRNGKWIYIDVSDREIRHIVNFGPAGKEQGK